MTDIVVLGAGPAGLGAAYRLAATGRHVTVLERATRVGGLAGSFEVAGQRVDHGSHRLHPSTPAPIMAVIRALLGDDLQQHMRNGRIRISDRFIAFPPRAVDLVTSLPPLLSARLAFDMATSPLRRARGDTFADVVRASLGPTMTTRFYAPFVQKLFGVPADELAGELARRRVGARGAASLVRRAVHPDATRGFFFYPRRGYGQIFESLAAAAATAGAEIRTGCEVHALRADADGVTATLAGGSSVAARSCWSTLPLPVLARLADAPDAVAGAAARLETRALLLVYLALPIPQWTPHDAHYFPELDVLPSRCSEPKNYRFNRDDPAGTTVLCAEVPCTVGDHRWVADDGELAATVRESLARCGLPMPEPFEVVVRRVPNAYPVYRVGYEQAFTTVDAWATSLPNVLHFGRQGLFAHDNAHHALVMAWAAADALDARGDVDPECWAAARAAFTAHVVED